MSQDRTFVKITNRMIYNRLEDIDKKFDKVNLKANVNSAVIAVLTIIVVAILTLLR